MQKSRLQNVTDCYNSTLQNPLPEVPEPPRPNPDLSSRQLLAAHTKPLSAQQLTAIDLLIAGRSDAKAAAILNVHRVTVTRWRLYNHIFQAELNRRRQEVYSAASDQLRAILTKAVRVFQKQVRSQDQQIAFRAARALLHLAGSSHLVRPADPAHAPTEPTAVLDLEARKCHIELGSIDPRTDPLDEDDRALALRRLLYRNAINPIPDDPANDARPDAGIPTNFPDNPPAVLNPEP